MPNEENAEASFTFNLEADSEVTDEQAKSLEELRRKVVGSTESIKAMRSAMSSLKGDTKLVTAAKNDLAAKIETEKQRLSDANVKLLKHGVLYDKLSTKTKHLASERKRLADEAKKGAFAKELRNELGLGKNLTLAVGIAAAVAAVGTLIGKVIELGSRLLHFIPEAANWTRNMHIMAEAASGSAENADALASHVDRLSEVVSTSKEKLYELATATTKALSGTQVGGQGIIDTFEAVARTSDAMGDSVGKALGDLVERGKMFGRVQINPFELVGTGLPSFDLIASKLAKNLKIGADKAREALLYGVKADDAAKALLDASIERYGKVNAKKFLSLESIAQRFHDRLVGLVPAGWIDKGLENIEKLSMLFDKSTVSGDVWRQLLEIIGKGLGQASGEAISPMKRLIDYVQIGALKMAIAFFETNRDFKRAFQNIASGNTLPGIRVAFFAAAAGATALAVALGLVLSPFLAIGAVIDQVLKLSRELSGSWGVLGSAIVKDLVSPFTTLGHALYIVGKGIIEGLEHGIADAWAGLKARVTSIADRVKTSFKDALGIHSPSAVFREYGKQTGAGYQEGLEASEPKASAAAVGMAPASPGAGSGGRSSGAPQVTVYMTVTVAAGTSPKAAAQAITEDEGFRGKLTKLFEDAARSLALPTQTAVQG